MKENRHLKNMMTGFVVISLCMIANAVYWFLSENPWAVRAIGISWTILFASIPVITVIFALVKIFRPKAEVIERDSNGMVPFLKVGGKFIDANLMIHPVWKLNRHGVRVIEEGDHNRWAFSRLAALNRGGVKVPQLQESQQLLLPPTQIEVVSSQGQYRVIDAIASEIPA